jgi:hypothetical protein
VTAAPERRRKLTTFAIGLGVRLGGLGLIALGDGHDNPWAKASVIVGVFLSIAGIAVLRFLLFRPLLRKFRRQNNG